MAEALMVNETLTVHRVKVIRKFHTKPGELSDFHKD